MEEKDIDRLARLERERAYAEMEEMERKLRETDKKLDAQQKRIVKKAINENLEEHNAKRSTIWIFALLVVILAGSYFSLIIYRPYAAYKKAAELMQSGHYDDARAIYSQLGTYKDSAELMLECDYKKGSYLIASGKYTSAMTALAGIKGYKDRDMLIADLAGTAVQTIATGEKHSVFVRSVRTVKAVGDNSSGQCNVDAWRDIVSVACGRDFTVGLTSDGSVVATNAEVDWSNIVEIAAGDSFFAGLDKDGNVHFYGADGSFGGIKHIAAAGGVFAGVTDGGKVVVSGSSADVSGWSDIEDIVVNPNAVYGLKADGTVKATNGRLANAADIRCIFAVNDTVIAIDRENRFYAAGDMPVANFENALMIAGGYGHCLMLLDTGYVRFVGTAESGDDAVDDWTDILFRIKE